MVGLADARGPEHKIEAGLIHDLNFAAAKARLRREGRWATCQNRKFELVSGGMSPGLAYVQAVNEFVPLESLPEVVDADLGEDELKKALLTQWRHCRADRDTAGLVKMTALLERYGVIKAAKVEEETADDLF